MTARRPARRWRRARWIASTVALLGLGGALLLGQTCGCVATVRGAARAATGADSSVCPADPRAVPDAAGGAGPFVAARREGARGGQVAYVLPGTVEQVLAMLLDFDHATGRRPWAREYRVLERQPERVLAEWQFHGKLGIAPRVQIEFTVGRSVDERVTVRFGLHRAAFGLAAYFGDHRLTQLAGDPPRVLVQSCLFIDSGIFFANASLTDIEKGLRADAAAMAQWMRERLGVNRPADSPR